MMSRPCDPQRELSAEGEVARLLLNAMECRGMVGMTVEYGVFWVECIVTEPTTQAAVDTLRESLVRLSRLVIEEANING